jgi:transcriptional enhancer factor
VTPRKLRGRLSDQLRREAALLEGHLDSEASVIVIDELIRSQRWKNTKAVGSKSDKSFGRFPMRNRFISDYVYETTGKRRTPKQVGSRLQQLRDTCKKDKSEILTFGHLLKI